MKPQRAHNIDSALVAKHPILFVFGGFCVIVSGVILGPYMALVVGFLLGMALPFGSQSDISESGGSSAMIAAIVIAFSTVVLSAPEGWSKGLEAIFAFDDVSLSIGGFLQEWAWVRLDPSVDPDRVKPPSVMLEFGARYGLAEIAGISILSFMAICWSCERVPRKIDLKSIRERRLWVVYAMPGVVLLLTVGAIWGLHPGRMVVWAPRLTEGAPSLEGAVIFIPALIIGAAAAMERLCLVWRVRGAQ